MRAAQSKPELVESSISLVKAESKGKAPGISPSNPKKRKLVKALEVEPKKSKLLTLAMFAAQAVEVCY